MFTFFLQPCAKIQFYQNSHVNIFLTAMCNNKTDPLSGSLNVTSNGLITKANFKCAEGYYLDGLPQLECLPGGVWNGPDPVCSKSYS